MSDEGIQLELIERTPLDKFPNQHVEGDPVYLDDPRRDLFDTPDGA